MESTAGQLLAGGNIPRHVAIIMDGNGRWAQKRNLQRTAGHEAGVNAVRKVIQAADRLKIPLLTLFTFSTENWKRPKLEVSSIMQLLYNTTRTELKELIRNNVRLIATGRIDELSPRRRQVLESAIQQTGKNTGLTLNLALNYSGRREILEAVRSLCTAVKKNGLQPNEIDEKLFSQYLYTGSLPDPDLLIRTSGEMRLSNFLLWQASYTELYVTDVLWPDFEEKDFFKAIHDYQKRDRRFGTIK
ncbi:MAG: isoprenyl transferase [candidate division Zixibacteria bacterium]|nr:isoprenyl transferase [candidate division Zixibacteria bacterium]